MILILHTDTGSFQLDLDKDVFVEAVTPEEFFFLNDVALHPPLYCFK